MTGPARSSGYAGRKPLLERHLAADANSVADGPARPGELYATLPTPRRDQLLATGDPMLTRPALVPFSIGQQ